MANRVAARERPGGPAPRSRLRGVGSLFSMSDITCYPFERVLVNGAQLRSIVGEQAALHIENARPELGFVLITRIDPPAGLDCNAECLVQPVADVDALIERITTIIDQVAGLKKALRLAIRPMLAPEDRQQVDRAWRNHLALRGEARGRA